jgi:hypothetical protein
MSVELSVVRRSTMGTRKTADVREAFHRSRETGTKHISILASHLSDKMGLDDDTMSGSASSSSSINEDPSDSDEDSDDEARRSLSPWLWRRPFWKIYAGRPNVISRWNKTGWIGKRIRKSNQTRNNNNHDRRRRASNIREK